jgi:hypothetical protein
MAILLLLWAIAVAAALLPAPLALQCGPIDHVVDDPWTLLNNLSCGVLSSAALNAHQDGLHGHIHCSPAPILVA